MKKPLLVWCCLFLLASYLPLWAQAAPQKNFKGMKGFVFEFDNFELDEFKGGIGFKKWCSHTMAGIISLDWSWDTDRHENTDNDEYNKYSNFAIGLSGSLEKHYPLFHKCSPYFGGELSVGYHTSKQVNASLVEQELKKAEAWDKDFFIEPSITFGVEYFFTDNISLAGHYALGAFYSSGKSHQEWGETPQEWQGKQFGFSTWSSGLILCFYLN